MSEDKNKEVNQEDTNLGQESSTDDKKDHADGSQPDDKAQLESLKKDIVSIKKEAKHSKEVSENMQNALKVERNKRKAAQDKLDGKEEEPEFDPTEMANFKKAAKAAGILTKDELEKIQSKKSQEESNKKNTKVFQEFVAKNNTIFGTGDEADEQQEKNLKAFSVHLNELYDINKDTLAGAKNLSKKLAKALNDLKGEVNVAAAETRGADKERAQIKNNALLSIGAGGTGSTIDDDKWKYGTSQAEAAKLLGSIGYNDKEIKEMIETAKK